MDPECARRCSRDSTSPPSICISTILRHEAGCRWIEQGWPIHHVQEMLGHANISQTSTYLHATETGLAESMRKFDASRCIPVADEKPIEPPSIGNEETDDAAKSTLH